VGEMLSQFWERLEWCPHLETSGSKVYDIILGPADGRVHLVARLEEAAWQLWVMQD
jgi:hypothetical protein